MKQNSGLWDVMLENDVRQRAWAWSWMECSHVTRVLVMPLFLQTLHGDSLGLCIATMCQINRTLERQAYMSYRFCVQHSSVSPEMQRKTSSTRLCRQLPNMTCSSWGFQCSTRQLLDCSSGELCNFCLFSSTFTNVYGSILQSPEGWTRSRLFNILVKQVT